MTKTQRLITDFFKVKHKNSQKLITDYFKPSIEKRIHHYSAAHDYAKSYKYFKKYKPTSDAIQTYRGYCYRATSDFTEYNVYTTFDKFIIHQHKKIFIKAGTHIATASIDSDSALTHVSVDSLFQKQGIEHNSRYRLTQEGATLIQSCQRKGILDDEQVILNMVPTSPSIR